MSAMIGGFHSFDAAGAGAVPTRAVGGGVGSGSALNPAVMQSQDSIRFLGSGLLQQHLLNNETLQASQVGTQIAMNKMALDVAQEGTKTILSEFSNALKLADSA